MYIHVTDNSLYNQTVEANIDVEAGKTGAAKGLFNTSEKD